MNRGPSRPDTRASQESISYEVSFLEMDTAPAGTGRPAPEGFFLHRRRDPDVEEFRRLYDGVGADYAWTDMHSVPPEELAAFVRNPLVEFYLLTDPEDREAGFFQLDFRCRDGDGVAEIAYFGLMPIFRGMGIGAWLLDEAIRKAWREGVARLDVNTCTLDHPAALRTYLRAGFRIARVETRTRRGESTGWRK